MERKGAQLPASQALEFLGVYVPMPVPRASWHCVGRVAFLYGPQRESRIREKVESRVSKFTALRSVRQKAKADPACRRRPLTP